MNGSDDDDALTDGGNGLTGSAKEGSLSGARILTDGGGDLRGRLNHTRLRL